MLVPHDLFGGDIILARTFGNFIRPLENSRLQFAENIWTRSFSSFCKEAGIFENVYFLQLFQIDTHFFIMPARNFDQKYRTDIWVATLGRSGVLPFSPFNICVNGRTHFIKIHFTLRIHNGFLWLFFSNRDEYWSNTPKSFIFNKYAIFNKKYINLFSYIFSFFRICNAFTKNGEYFQLVISYLKTW